jgi:hypothetical protein
MNQDGNREFITFIPAINTLEIHILSTLIYQSEFGALMDTWLDNYNNQNLIALFATSEKDWSNENIGIH